MTETRPFIRLRGRSIMALVLTPEPPLPGWLSSLDAQIERAPNFFDNRPVIVDLGTLPRETPDVAGLMHAIVSRFDVGDQRARALLASSGLSVAMQSRPIGRLSGGQKARLGMLLLRLAQPNFYLLDEPTNHLDIEGQEALEDELLEHQASCLLVSHDRNFVRAVGNRFWLIEKKKLVELEGPERFFASIGATG